MQYNRIGARLVWPYHVFAQQTAGAIITESVMDILRAPFEGMGKPEALKGDLSGFWSRRINDEHRLVYTIKTDDVVVIACRFHYGD